MLVRRYLDDLRWAVVRQCSASFFDKETHLFDKCKWIILTPEIFYRTVKRALSSTAKALEGLSLKCSSSSIHHSTGPSGP